MKKKLVSVLMMLCLLTAAMASGGAEGPESYLGKPMPDFTVTTFDGYEFTLSEELKTHKAVLVNFWATWCWPCELEFPYMEQAYQKYRDDVAVIALSIDGDDTPEMLIEYAEAHELTFSIGSDSVALSELFVDVGIPTTVLVDRFGNVALIEIGAQTSEQPFVNAFALLTGDAYTETAVMDGFPENFPDAVGESTTITVRFVDQYGDPVPGCIINFCTDTACLPIFADENGVVVYEPEGETNEYHLQVIRVPAGYEFDTTQEFTARIGDAERVFTIMKRDDA